MRTRCCLYILSLCYGLLSSAFNVHHIFWTLCMANRVFQSALAN